MRRGKNQGRRAKRWGRDSAYLLGNGAGRGRWARGTSKRGVKGFGRHYKPSWRR